MFRQFTNFYSVILYLRNGTVVNDDGEEQVDVYIEVLNQLMLADFWLLLGLPLLIKSKLSTCLVIVRGLV